MARFGVALFMSEIKFELLQLVGAEAGSRGQAISCREFVTFQLLNIFEYVYAHFVCASKVIFAQRQQTTISELSADLRSVERQNLKSRIFRNGRMSVNQSCKCMWMLMKSVALCEIV